MRFEGTSAYVATDDLKIAVNAAIALERPGWRFMGFHPTAID